MKATTFVAETVPAEAFIEPDPVALTIGALVNRLLDRTDDPLIIIIDQVSAQPTILAVKSIANAQMAESANFAALVSNVQAADEEAIVFLPGDEPGAPFEG